MNRRSNRIPPPPPPTNPNLTRSAYHHGNLRAALLQAGLELIAERGIEGITLRRVAQRAGVSHAAPYHHFPDKAALIEGLAVAGYGHLQQRLVTAKNRTKGPANRKIRALGLAYVRFAFDRTAEFQLMNRPELRRQTLPQQSSALSQAARGAFRVLLDAITEGQKDGSIAPGDVDQLALACWSTVHGFATIVLDGLMSDPLPPTRVPARLRQVLAVLGMGIEGRGERTAE